MTIQLDPNEQALVALIEETQMSLGRIVRLNRKVLDLTQSDFGARAGVHQTCICSLEKHGTMTFDLLIRAAHGLGLPASRLLQAAEDRESIIKDCSLKTELHIQSLRRSAG